MDDIKFTARQLCLLLAAILLIATSTAAQQAVDDTATTAGAMRAPVLPAMQDTLPAPVIDEGAAAAKIFLDKVEVLGTLAKPQALFIIPGRDPAVEGIEADRSFFREIFRPMEKDYHPKNTRRYVNGQILW